MLRARRGEVVDDVLHGARVSYANWPEERELSFRDVVHYLAATHLTGRHGTVGSDIRPVINRHLPSQW